MKTYPQEMVRLGDLNPAEYNPRQMSEVEMQNLIRSLREFGFVEPVVAREEDYLIIGGHQRVIALRRLMEADGVDGDTISATMIPVVRVSGVDDERAKLLNLALNKIGGDWHYDKLASLFASLSDQDPALLGVSGFSPAEIEDILSLCGGADPAIPEPTFTGSALDDAINEGLAAQARRFVFAFDKDEDALLCREVLAEYGMTGPGNAAEALAKVLGVAKGRAPAKETEPPVKKDRKPRKAKPKVEGGN